jgi:micrococcal nuclease
MRRERRLSGGLALLSLLLLGVLAPSVAIALESATVIDVVDGDTVRVRISGRAATLRLIGLDTPETRHPQKPVQCFGYEATAKARLLLPRGLGVVLEADRTQGERDKYGRLLRYLWLPDGRNFAEVMIADGYGTQYTYTRPYWYREAFRAAQRAARDAERGLWAPTACEARIGPTRAPPERRGARPPAMRADGRRASAHPCDPGQVKGNRNSGVYHAPGQRHYGRISANVACFQSEADAAAAGFRRAQR